MDNDYYIYQTDENNMEHIPGNLESYNEDTYEYDEFIYEGFDFERPIYAYIWEILVIITTLFNIAVVIVFIRKRMRSIVHSVLVVIAISDTLTGLVTLPTYIHVYSHYEPGNGHSKEAYILDKDWCNAFMVSKFFLSKWLHTVSIWLTVFLALHRFVCVVLPTKVNIIFTVKTTLICIVVIVIVSPILHIYHLLDSKADVTHGMCQWIFKDEWGIAYLWTTLILMHILPCLLLVIFTILMIWCLCSSPLQVNSRKNKHSSSASMRLHKRNRNLTILVSVIVVIFLIPEVPYGIYSLYTVLRRQYGMDVLALHTNRAFHAAYELLLVLSFHANFWVYAVLNKKFRAEFKTIFNEAHVLFTSIFGIRSRSMSVSSAMTQRFPVKEQTDQV